MGMRTSSFIHGLAAVVTLAGCSGQNIDDGSSVGAPEAGPSGAGAGGATVIASQIQLTPLNLVSDGTTLFWTSAVGRQLSSMPVGGGAITTVVPAPGASGGFLAADDLNVYYYSQQGLARVQKGGGTPSLITDTSAVSAAVLGSTLYWLDQGPVAHTGSAPDAGASLPPVAGLVLESAPLKGGAVTQIAEIPSDNAPGGPNALGVTTSTAFVSSLAGTRFFSLTDGLPEGGAPESVPGAPACLYVVSDDSAVYCETQRSIVAIGNDGSTTTLGTAVLTGLVSGGVAIDDTYVYWADSTTVGTIMRAPKTGGSAPTILARDTQPIAVAVDANAVYWSDQGGNIWRLPK
jgi:hypothetical protein